MNTEKAVGPDRIPTNQALQMQLKMPKATLRIDSKIWLEEEVPAAFARATFVMLYKNKGSSNDPKK